MVGTQMTGKRLGILGMGRVGQVVAKRARGFEMEIHYHNRHRLPPELECGAKYHESLNALLGVSQILSLHCPASPENRRIINRERIAQLPEGAVLVNTARGALIEEKDLFAALNSGHLAAAGLDVYDNEPAIDPAFARIQKIFLLPHIGSATHETRDAMGFRALDNLDSIFAGKEPGDRVA